MPDPSSFTENQRVSPVGGEGPAPGPLQRMVAALAVARRAFQRPYRSADWVIPLVIVGVIQLAMAFTLRDLFVAKALHDTQTRLEQSTNVTEEQREEALERTGQGVRIMSLVSPPIAVLLACVLTATVLLLIINFGLGGTARFPELWTVAVLSFTPKAIESILFGILARARSSIDISFGPAALVADESSLLRRVLSVFDVFDFWMIAIQIVGVAAVTNLAPGKARTAVFALWIAYWVITIAITVATRSLMGVS